MTFPAVIKEIRKEISNIINMILFNDNLISRFILRTKKTYINSERKPARNFTKTRRMVTIKQASDFHKPKHNEWVFVNSAK